MMNLRPRGPPSEFQMAAGQGLGSSLEEKAVPGVRVRVSQSEIPHALNDALSWSWQ